MSALEPDSPAPHVFPHVRDAIRSWWSHRCGSPPSRSALGAVRGKGPTVSDLVRVGRVMVDLDLTASQIVRLVEYARGTRSRSEDRLMKSLVERVTYRLRSMRIVAAANPRFDRRRDSYTDCDGKEHEVTYCVDLD